MYRLFAGPAAPFFWVVEIFSTGGLDEPSLILRGKVFTFLVYAQTRHMIFASTAKIRLCDKTVHNLAPVVRKNYLCSDFYIKNLLMTTLENESLSIELPVLAFIGMLHSWGRDREM